MADGLLDKLPKVTPSSILQQLLFPLLILAGFSLFAFWSVSSIYRAEEEKFIQEALTNCRVLEVAIVGESIQDAGIAGIQSQIDALSDNDPRIVRLSFIAAKPGDCYRHLASSLPGRIGQVANPEDLAAVAGNSIVFLDEEHGETGALDITYPVHDPNGLVVGVIGYTVKPVVPHQGPMLLLKGAVAVILLLIFYFFLELRRHRREILRRQKMEGALRTNNRIMNDFISTAAHELRTPLCSMLGYSEILLHPEMVGGDLGPERQREFLEEIHERTEALTRIVDELLDIARIESGRPIPLLRSPQNLKKILAPKLERYRTHHPSHHFELVLPEEELPAVPADAHKITQVLENLLSNAVKFSPAGGTIRVTAEKVDNALQIAVADQGIGMTPEECAQAFEKFYRADASDTAVPGLGLGMNITRGIVEAHGGRIWLESEAGCGTTVTLSLPLADPQI